MREITCRNARRRRQNLENQRDRERRRVQRVNETIQERNRRLECERQRSRVYGVHVHWSKVSNAVWVIGGLQCMVTRGRACYSVIAIWCWSVRGELQCGVKSSAGSLRALLSMDSWTSTSTQGLLGVNQALLSHSVLNLILCTPEFVFVPSCLYPLGPSLWWTASFSAPRLGSPYAPVLGQLSVLCWWWWLIVSNFMEGMRRSSAFSRARLSALHCSSCSYCTNYISIDVQCQLFCMCTCFVFVCMYAIP